MTPTKSGLCVNHNPSLAARMTAQKIAALDKANTRKAVCRKVTDAPIGLIEARLLHFLLQGHRGGLAPE